GLSRAGAGVSERRLGLGIDVGGTKIAAGIVDLETGEILDRRIVPTNAERGGRAVLDDMFAVAQELANAPLESIGVGVPEIVNPVGEIQTDAVISWIGLPVVQTLGVIAPAVIEADVRAAALAESRFGAGRGRGSFVYLTIGTGISSTIVLDGQPLAGARGGALVMASAPLDITCAKCGERSAVILEEFAGGPAIARRFAQATGRDTSGAVEVVEAAETGDLIAREILASSGREIGVSLAFLMNVVDPESIVVGGGLGNARGVFWESLIESTRQHIWNPSAHDLPIDRAHFGPESGIIGAALAAMHENQGSQR
ncbi:MAG: ROK family protein, partial [Thermomicrobiales bacterium]